MKKKLLIAGGGYADIPLIVSAKELGFHVITTGNRESDLGHHYSDEYVNEDFSNPEAMLRLAKRLNIDSICACCNDFSAISSAYVAEKLSIKGHDSYKTTLLLHHKDSYRSFALENNISSPLGKGYDSAKSAINELSSFKFPVIIKPVDLTGGKGISKANTLEEAQISINNAFSISRNKRVIIEEFLSGTNHGFSTMIKNERIIFSFMDNEHYFNNPYMVSGASCPSIASSDIERKLSSDINKIARILKLKDGILHTQFIIHNNEPVIIEVCRRSPGDLYIKFVELATSINYPSWIIKASTGQDISALQQKDSDGFYVRHCIMANNPGIIDKVVIDKKIKDKIIDQMLWWKKDDIITDHLVSKLGIIFLKFDSMTEMLELTHDLPKLINVITTQ